MGTGKRVTRRARTGELDRFFAMSIDMLCIAGFDGYFKRLNPAWDKTLGFSEQELLAQPYLRFVHPEDRASTISEAQKLTTGRITISVENRYLSNDGSNNWLLWTAAPSPQRQLIYAVARDITERKRAEEALRKAKDDLELTVAKRTAELSEGNERLRFELVEREGAATG